MIKDLKSQPDGSTPLEDEEGLIPTDITSMRELFIAEARNIAKAMIKYLASAPSARAAPFTLEWTLRLHREMFGEVWTWAGTRRQAGTNIGVEVYEIEPCLKDLMEDLKVWRQYKSYSVLEQSVRLHHRAVLIHPFKNGNGRWARMLANIWLKLCRDEPINWPEETIRTESVIRNQYLEAIRAADNQNYSPLTNLHQKYQKSQAKLIEWKSRGRSSKRATSSVRRAPRKRPD